MISAIIGFSTAIVVGFLVVTATTDSYTVYLNLIGLAVVVGGTFSATTISYSIQDVLRIFLVFIRIFKSDMARPRHIIEQLVRLASVQQQNATPMGSFANSDKVHPFIRDGLRLIENRFSEDKIIEVLETAIYERKRIQLNDIGVLTTLAKYPPAFGMIGTVIGLVALLYGLNSEDAQSMIGPNMSVALVTTLYGLLIANLIFQPMADNLTHRLKRDQHLRRMIVHGVVLLQRGEDPITVQEMLNAYELPHQRRDHFQNSAGKGQRSQSKGRQAA